MDNIIRKPSHASHAKQILKIGLICSVVALASGCGKTIKPEEKKPTKLVKLEKSVSLVKPVFSTSISSKSKLAKVNRFEVGFQGNQIVAASNTGMVNSYSTTGQELWSVDVGDEIIGGVAFNVANKTAVVTTKSAYVYAINTNTGSIKWKTKLDGTVLAPALIDGGLVILSGNDGMVHGLALTSGAPIWHFSTQTPSISVRGSAKPTLIDNQTALLATADGRLHGIDIATGLPQWSRRVGVPSGSSEIQRMTDIDGTPFIDGNQLFAVSYSGQLISVDISTGQILFVQEAASKNSLTVIGNAVVTTTLEGKVKAFHRQTGQPLWQNDALAYRNLSNPVAIGNYIAVGDLEGVVHFLDPVSGKIISRTQTKGAVNQLQSKDGYLFTQTTSGQINAWQLAR